MMACNDGLKSKGFRWKDSIDICNEITESTTIYRERSLQLGELVYKVKGEMLDLFKFKCLCFQFPIFLVEDLGEENLR